MAELFPIWNNANHIVVFGSFFNSVRMSAGGLRVLVHIELCRLIEMQPRSLVAYVSKYRVLNMVLHSHSRAHRLLFPSQGVVSWLSKKI